MIYILNKNKTRVIFVQVVLESWAAMFGCKWLVQYIKFLKKFKITLYLKQLYTRALFPIPGLSWELFSMTFANYPIHIQILYKTKNNKEKYNKI
jgi:hypothetical protein